MFLSSLGRREDALTAIDQAVTIRRQLARAYPAVFAPRLKSSLADVADLLDSMGKESEANATRAEADQLS